MRILLFAGLLAGLSGPAFASAGLDCGAEDARAAFAVHGGASRGMGGALFDFKGELEIKDKTIAEDLRRIGFELEHVAQYWFDADDLRLDLYREREGDKAHGTVELIIRTRTAGEDGGFEGSYELLVFDAAIGSAGKDTRITGKVSCSTE